MRALIAQTAAEVRMTLRRGETLLLTLGIPVGLLVFLSLTRVVQVSGSRVNFLTPGVFALSVLSTSLVALSIATGFERSYGVLRRLHVTPLGTRRLVGAKMLAVLVTECLQVAVLAGIGLALGWQPHGGPLGLLAVVAVLLLGSAGCAGIGLLLAGRLRAEVNLGASNALYLVLMMTSGIVMPSSDLPSAFARVMTWLPPGAMAEGLHRVLSGGVAPCLRDWVALSAWSVLAPFAAARTFSFD